MNAHSSLTDKRQSSKDLSLIQLTALISLPNLLPLFFLLRRYSLQAAVYTVILGNLGVWLIRYGIVKLSYQKRQSTLDIAFDCFGKTGGFIIGIFLLIDTLVWFASTISYGSDILIGIMGPRHFFGLNQSIQISILVAILSIFICMGGIRSLKRAAYFFFPILLIPLIYLSFKGGMDFHSNENAVNSLSGIGLIIGSQLAFSADLPTFFRHRSSWKKMRDGLTLFQLGSLIIGVLGLFFVSLFGFQKESDHFIVMAKGSLPILASALLVFASSIYANVYNIYSSSVAWEIFAPKVLIEKEEFTSLGLTLLITFFLLQGFIPFERLLEVVDVLMVNLTLVFFFYFTLKKLSQKKWTNTHRLVLLGIWMTCSIVNLLQMRQIGFEVNGWMIVTSILLVMSLYVAFELLYRIRQFIIHK